MKWLIQVLDRGKVANWQGHTIHPPSISSGMSPAWPLPPPSLTFFREQIRNGGSPVLLPKMMAVGLEEDVVASAPITFLVICLQEQEDCQAPNKAATNGTMDCSLLAESLAELCIVWIYMPSSQPQIIFTSSTLLMACLSPKYFLNNAELAVVCILAVLQEYSALQIPVLNNQIRVWYCPPLLPWWSHADNCSPGSEDGVELFAGILEALLLGLLSCYHSELKSRPTLLHKLTLGMQTLKGFFIDHG